jgi:glycosyltransferase involved in cell wall biosynthesis
LTVRRSAPLRVLWLVKGLGVGGIERLLCWTAAVRDAKAIDAQAAYVLRRADDLAGELTSTGVPVHPLEGDDEFDLVWAVRLRRILDEGSFDIVHFHSPYVAGIARLVIQSMPERERPRTMSTEHNVWSDFPIPSRALNAATFPLDHAHIAVSRAVRESVIRRFQNHVEVVTQGVPVEDVRRHLEGRDEARSMLGVEPDEVLAGTVANLRPPKGYSNLLKAAKEVVGKGLPVRFIAVGRGEEEADLLRLHRQLRLGDRFRFLGYRDDAVHVLGGCDLFVLPSLYEGVPVAVLEALAMGIPVVATPVGTVTDVVTDGVEGRLVPPGDPTALASAIAEVAGDPARRRAMADAAFHKGTELDIRRTTRRVEEIYREVAGP